MAVEEKRIEATNRGHLLAEIEKVGRLLFCIRTLSREGEWGVVMVERCFCIAKKTPEIHCS